MTIAWGITGCGHFLEENLALIRKLPRVDVFLSRAAVEVMKIYKFDPEQLHGPGVRLYREGAYSAPVIGRFYNGYYKVLIIAPATSNSVAKFVAGISDTLVTNLFAHAGKCRVPIIVLPSDQEEEVTSPGPRGMVQLFPRPIDLENTARLKSFPGVIVVSEMEELEKCLDAYL
ncbi:MAG: flavoprotein [Bacillota bacterium]|nr:flavoprotein [Bacillota bacterium]